MKFEHYRERVEESSEFKKFREKNKQAYLCAGFFVLDFEQGKHIHQVDFYLPKNKKIATFLLDKGVELKVSEMLVKKKLEELDGSSKTDIDAIKGIVTDEMHNRTITQDINKIIAVLQNEKGKKIWRVNCITKDLGIIRAHIDDETSSIIEFEKASLFDFVKKIPGTLHQQPPQFEPKKEPEKK